MHEKIRTKKVRRDPQRVKLLEARRLQRLAAKIKDVYQPTPTTVVFPKPIKQCQNQVIHELAWKTVILMQRNKIIQEEIVALQKETSDFIAMVMNKPEYLLYLEPLRLQDTAPAPMAKDESAPVRPTNFLFMLK